MKPDPDKMYSGGAILRSPTGETCVLTHGDIIGRLWSAGMHISDGRVSEAHAAITVRGTHIMLMGLRGRFKVNDVVMRSLRLQPGQQILLAPGVRIDVVSVFAAHEVLRVSAPNGQTHTVRSTVALTNDPDQPFQTGVTADATCHVWATGMGWQRSSPSGPVLVGDGQSWSVSGQRFVAHIGPPEDVHTQGVRVRSPAILAFDARGLTLRVGDESVRIRGRSANLLRELVALSLPVDWNVLASTLWADVQKDKLRPRWDMQLLRLRDKLRQAGGRVDLIRADGTGLVELVLAAGDTVTGL